jgi:hypothetical protein
VKLLALCSGLLLAAQSICFGTTIRFDELGTLSLIDVNGIHIQGVLLGFSPDHAFFNQVVGTGGNAVLSIDPVLSGPTTGFLTLGFDVPTSLLQFDVLLQSIFPLDDSDQGANGGPAYTVLLSNGVSLTGSTEPQPNGVYSEGTFLYSGAPISGAVISFFNGFDAGGLSVSQFGLDNLTFVTPEPGSFFGLGFGLLALGMLGRRRAARQPTI